METTRDRRSVTSARRGREPNAAFQVPPFMRLARVHAGSAAGDAMVAAALAGTIFFSAAASDARDKTFLYLALTMAPFAVVAPLIGPALDRARSGRRWIVIGSAVLRALLCLVLIGRTDSLLLYPAAFAILVIQKGYGIARSSLVPAVVESDAELVEANSKLQLLSGIMGFVGVAPAALLFKLFDDDPGPALGLAVLTFAGTAGLAVLLPKVAVAPTPAGPEEKAELRTVGVLLAAASMGLLRGIVGFLTVYYAFHFREADQLAAFAVVAAVSLLGTLLGSVAAPRLRQVWPEERMLISVLVFTFTAGVLALAVGGVPGAALLGAVVGVSSTAGKLAFDSIVQRDAPDANRGRLFAKFETRFQLIWVVGAMLGLLPFGALRVPFGAVALVAGFATFTYVVGLAAWRHRTGATSSSFGRQAVLIDQAMTEAQDKAKRRVRDSSRALVRRVRTRGEGAAPRPARPPVAPVRAGPGVGGALPARTATPADAAPTAAVPPSPAPGPPATAPAPPVPDDPTVFAPAPAPPRPDPGQDPTVFAPASTPPPDATRPWPGEDDPTHRVR
ncbi:MAG TPA: MFS transporter [Acidimicrobiales bacterium]|nr:MFS transporter [Acidimicrobiales bacterium]